LSEVEDCAASVDSIEHQRVVHGDVLVHDQFASFGCRHSTDVGANAMKLGFAEPKQLVDVLFLIGLTIWVDSLNDGLGVLHH